MAENIKSYPNLIDGNWMTLSDTRLEDRNPAEHKEIIGLFPMATLDDTKRAIQAARLAFPAWSRTPPRLKEQSSTKQARSLHPELDEIATVLTREEGKTPAEAKGEVTRACDIFKYYASVGDEIADAYVSALFEATRNLKVGNGLENGVQMGPLVNQDQLQTSQSYIALGQKEGARLLLGGEVDEEKGYFAQATIFDRVEPTMRIAQEEIFGPVIGIIRAKDINGAIEKTNAIPFGLCAGIVTNDLKAAFAFANQVDAGVVKINEPTTGLALNAPFGGFKQSSANTFKEQGQAAMDFYTRTKTIDINHG